MSDVGKVIRELRGKQSLREASEKIGISHTYLDTIEKGFDKRSGNEVNPSPDTLRLISDAYNYPYEKLLQHAGYIDEANEENEENTDPKLQHLINEIKLWHKKEPKNKDEKMQMIMDLVDIFKED